jgi:NTP pyrophosphatase (non-canonical NTP hydrolase)
MNLTLTNELEPIRQWAKQRGIIDHGNPMTQTVKLMEEVGELAHALLRSDGVKTVDALGDCVIVLVSVASLCGVKLEDCINQAYAEISERTGQMVNHNFIKDEK